MSESHSPTPLAPRGATFRHVVKVRSPCCALIAGCGACLVAVASPRGRAQEPESQSESRLHPGILHLRPIDLALEFEASYENRTVRSKDQRRRDSIQRNRDTRFSEVLDLGLGGDLVDPSFAQWNGSLQIGLRQERYREEIDPWTDQSDSSDGLLLEYDLSVDLLSTKPVSGRAYARQVRDRLPRRFLPSLLEERAESGLAMFFKLGDWNSEIGFDWSDVERSGNSDGTDDEHFRSNSFYVNNEWRISESQRLRINYDHNRDQSDYQGSRGRLTTDRDDLRIDHELLLGQRNQHRLDTYFRWSDERGDLARNEIELTPRLLLRHTDEFETAYRYNYYHLDEDSAELRQQKVDWQAIWRPDERFRITADTFGLWEDYEDDAETHQFGGGLHTSYRRPTNLGQLSMYAAFTADELRNFGSDGDRLIRSEGHTLDPTVPTYLLQSDIQRASIQAYNRERTRVYIHGSDYLVQQIGRRTIVYRLLTGRIAEGELVFFDYRYSVPLDGRTDTYRVDARIEHEFSMGLTPYYAFELRRQDVSGSLTAAYEDNTDRHRFGLNFRRPSWAMNGEIELFHDLYEPYDAAKFDMRATVLQVLNWSAEGAARYAYYDFTGDDDRRRVHRLDLDLSGTVRFDPRFSGKLATAFRWEDDTSRGETTGVDLECGLHYQRGQLGVDLTIEYDLLSIVDEREDGFGVWLTVRRDLSHLLATGRRRQTRAVQ